MGSLAGFLDYLHKTSPLSTHQTPGKAVEAVLAAERSVREITGAAGVIDYLYRTSVARHVEAAVARRRILQEAIREITGGHYPAGTPLVRLRCGCNKWVATIERGEDGKILTYWRRRRYPGVPPVECPDHGRLVLETSVLMEKMRAARRSGRPRNYRP
jgi:hypothetical protein